MRIVVLLVAACAANPAPPPKNVAPAEPAPAAPRLECVADNGGGEKTEDLAGHVVTQTCAMIYDCSNGPGQPRTAKTGDVVLDCTNTHCTCEVTRDVPHRTDHVTFEAAAPCDRLDALLAQYCGGAVR